jgi:FAD/FMN-containing dehydrogenase
MAEFAALGTTSTGELWRRGEQGYEPARLAAVWNDRKPQRHPDAILVAADIDDVLRAVGMAREAGWTIGIRSGGHSWVGNAVRDGGLLLDLSRFDSIELDEANRRVAVGPAAKGPAINAVLMERGWFFPTGHAPTVGIGGFILGGGYGWNSRSHGPACLSIQAIDVVLADGQVVHADDTTHPDLLWAARGSGPGFFGVVTRFYLDIHPAPTSIVRTVHSYPLALQREVLAWSYDAVDRMPPQVEMSCKVGYTPGLDQQTISLTATAFCTDASGTDVLAPLEEIPCRSQALASRVAVPTTMAELYDAADRLNPQGQRWAIDGIWLDGAVDPILDAASPMLTTIPAGYHFVLWMLWGGYPTRDNACWSVQAKAYLSPNAGWTDPDEDLDHERWVHTTMTAMQAMSRGLQFSDNNLADRFDRGLSVSNAERLERVRSRYDPSGLFATYMRPEESTTAYGRSLRG